MNEGQRQYIDQRTNWSRQVLERVVQDPAFREELVTNPKATLSIEYGISIPDDADVRVFEETANSHYVVLPPREAQNGEELSEEELEAVAGGYWVNLLWSAICFGSGEGGPDNGDLSVSVA